MHGQLGLQSVEEKLVPTHASLLDEWNVTLISAGYGHSTVLTADVRLDMNLYKYAYTCIVPTCICMYMSMCARTYVRVHAVCNLIDLLKMWFVSFYYMTGLYTREKCSPLEMVSV